MNDERASFWGYFQPAWRGLLIGLATLVVVLVLWQLNYFVQARLALTNQYFVSRPTSEKVVIVAIDEKTIAELGLQTTWSRAIYADLVQQLLGAGVRVIGFDILFDQPREGDDAFIGALQTAREARVPIVLPISGQNWFTSYEGTLEFKSQLHAYDEIQRAASHVGYINAFPDPDGVIRRAMLMGQVGDESQISFSVATYLASLRISPNLYGQVITREGQQVALPNITLQVDEQGFWQQNYYGAPTQSFPILSLVDVLNGDFEAGQFQDKMVLVGLVEATGLVDSYTVPTSRSGELMSGVEIQAHTIETLLSAQPLTQQSRLSQALTIVLLALGCGVLLAYLRWYWMIAAIVGIGYGLIVASSLIFDVGLVVVNLLHPFMVLVLVLFFSIGAEITREVARRQATETLLQSIVNISRQGLTIERIAPLIAETVRKLTRSPIGEIWVADETRQLYRAEAWGGFLHTPQLIDKLMEKRRTYQEGEVWLIPVMWQSQPIAAFVVQQTPTLRFNGGIQRLEQFALRLAPTIDSALLYIQTQNQAHQLRGILAESPSGIFVLDSDLNVARANEAIVEWLQIELHESVGKPIQDVFVASKLENSIWQQFHEHLQAGEPFRQEIKIGERTYQWDAVQLTQSSYWVITLSDVSDLAELNHLKTRMIRMASHDLKNPLGRVLGYTDLLLDMVTEGELPAEEATRYLERIVKSADEMNNIITEILSLEQLRSGKIPREPLSMLNVLQNILDRYATDAKEKRQSFFVDVAEQLPMVNGNFNQLVQAVSNVVGNAIKYTPEEGRIHIRMFITEAQSIRLEVTDTGYGMPKEALAKLFTDFYRVRTQATAHISGTGLGLSLVKSVVVAHEGKIWVESEEGVGSTFTIELPALPSGS
ncbi:MAG: CHASE2 domain-containing protein [Phototrophicaceae bacterium]